MPEANEVRNRPCAVSDLAQDDAARISLCEVLDRVLNKGVVVVGEATISVANIDLIYLGLQLVLTSIEAARETIARAPIRLGASSSAQKEISHGLV